MSSPRKDSRPLCFSSLLVLLLKHPDKLLCDVAIERFALFLLKTLFATTWDRSPTQQEQEGLLEIGNDVGTVLPRFIA